MQVVKLNATHSTNSFLREMIYKNEMVDYTVVVAKHQTNGRGQMGTVWESEEGKNLMFSMFKDLSMYKVKFPFYISMVVSLAIFKALRKFNVPDLRIKWPNDILSADQKICGILIENIIKDKLNSTIIGVGLNVNQTKFINLPKASSLKNINGIHYNLDEILFGIVEQLKNCFLMLQDEGYDSIKKEYEISLFRKNKPSTFKDKQGTLFSGIINGIDTYGNLQVALEDNIVKKFELKDIVMLY